MSFMALKAAESGIDRLYHYEGFSPEYLKDALVNKRVHFSNPKNFNDPWDCYPCFDTTAVNDPAYRARFMATLRPLPILGLTAAEHCYAEARLQEDSDLLRELIKTTTEFSRKMILDRWRIYCLTPHSETPLMWSHYADKHQGICLEFDAGKAVIGNAWQVQYREALPVLDILELATDKGTFEILVSKSYDWRYEDEYRILARDREAPDVTPQFLPITNKEFLPLPQGALTAIIAGCRANLDEIKALVEKHAPGLPVKRAVQAPDRYSLSIQA
jgi:hypothetical protein